MTDDVARKAISSNGYYNGSKIVRSPNQDTLSAKNRNTPIINRTQTVDELETLYTDRFDDVRYYTGDSASGA